MEQLIVFVMFAVVGAMYFAPAIVGGLRQHHQLGPIVIINVFLGWTLLGWVVAMAMAASQTKLPPATAWQHHAPAGWNPPVPPPAAARTDGQYLTQRWQTPPSALPATPYGEPQERSA